MTPRTAYFRDYARARRAAFRALGLCADCKAPAAPFYRCAGCRAKYAAWGRAYWSRKRAA